MVAWQIKCSFLKHMDANLHYYSSCLTWYYRNIILQRINSVVVLCTRIVLLLELLLCWWVELRTMLRHLNRRGLNGITWALLTVYNLQCIIRFSLTLMLSSVKTMTSSRFWELNIWQFIVIVEIKIQEVHKNVFDKICNQITMLNWYMRL